MTTYKKKFGKKKFSKKKLRFSKGGGLMNGFGFKKRAVVVEGWKTAEEAAAANPVAAEEFKKLDTAKKNEDPKLCLKAIIAIKNIDKHWEATGNIHFVQRMTFARHNKHEPKYILDMADLTLQLYKKFSDAINNITKNRSDYFKNEINKGLAIELKVIESLVFTINHIFEQLAQNPYKYNLDENDKKKYIQLVQSITKQWSQCSYVIGSPEEKLIEDNIYKYYATAYDQVGAEVATEFPAVQVMEKARVAGLRWRRQGWRGLRWRGRGWRGLRQRGLRWRGRRR